LSLGPIVTIPTIKTNLTEEWENEKKQLATHCVLCELWELCERLINPILKDPHSIKWRYGMNLKSFTVAILICTMVISVATAEEKHPIQPSKKDKCPVCGMFVYKYPDWVGEIIFKDGSTAFFDGPKDLFKYYFNLKKYNPEKTIKDITAIYVTEYYDMEIIDAKTAVFVIGSDVYGPMGRELIPFVNKSDAEGFKKDHKGKRILRFEDIKPGIIKKLD